MRFGVEVKEEDVNRLFQILNSKVGKEYELEDIIIQLAKRSIPSTDIFFLALQKLSEKNLIESRHDFINVVEKIDEQTANEIKFYIKRKVERMKKLFVTPLEVAKFYQCPRRLWLEKIILSRQFKERRGKVWDGEVVHLAISLLIKRMKEEDIEKTIEECANIALKKFEGKTELSADTLKNFLKKFYELVKEDGFTFLFTEKTLESFKHGVIGTPDVIGIKEDSIVPMDLKFGRVSRRGIKDEHVLQSVGEAILVEDYFRKRVDYSYLVYFQSNFLARIKITTQLKKKFFNYKNGIIKTFSSNRIPPMSRLPNFRNRVCKGCHVRPACDNIEMIKKLGRKYYF